MHRKPILGACLLASLLSAWSVNATALGTTYYISTGGDDGRDGLRPSTAWRTLARAHRSARTGDTILLRRGEVFRETADFGSEDPADETVNMTFGAYGPEAAPNPVISGGVAVTGWCRLNGASGLMAACSGWVCPLPGIGNGSP